MNCYLYQQDNDTSLEIEDIEFLYDDYNNVQASLLTTSTVQATKNIDSNDENIDPSMLIKSKKSSSRQKVNEVKDSTRVIAEVAEKNYLLKKNFYEESIQCKQRMAEAQERMATVAEKYTTKNCKIM